MVRLIGNSEKFFVNLFGAKFYYRRITIMAWKAYVKKHESFDGKVDLNNVSIDVVSDYLLDWENVKGTDGKPIKFDKKLVQYLPDDVLAGLLNAIRSVDGNEVDVEKK